MEIKYLLTHFWLCNVMGVLELDMEALPVSSVSHVKKERLGIFDWRLEMERFREYTLGSLIHQDRR